MTDVQDFFGKHAKEYANSKSHAKGSDLALLIKFLEPKASDTALDVAAGTGFTAVELGKRVRTVVAYDKVSEMLDQARLLANRELLKNIDFVKGDINNMPFEQESFDIVTCRRAAHHFGDKGGFVRQSYRLLKEGGKFGLSDMVKIEADDKELFNGLERIRDSSHVGAESVEGWSAIIRDAGFRIVRMEVSEERLKFQDWLYPIELNSEQGEECINFTKNNSEELSKLIGYDSREDTLLKRRLVLVAEK